MKTGKRSTETTFKHREWQIVPDAIHGHCFNLEEVKTGKLLAALILPEGSNSRLLSLIASAPELQDIAEMYQQSMTGSRAENSMLFSMVTQVLQRTTQPYSIEDPLCV